MKKRMFWSLFKPAWEASFTPKNIINGFAKCGIWPINPSTVCGLLPPKEDILRVHTNTTTLSTPISCRAVRRLEKSYKTSPTAYKLGVVFRSLHRLAAQHSIDNHTNRGLRWALADQKKRKKKRRNLNLHGEEAGKPEFWGHTEVIAANEYQAAQDAQTEAKKLQTADRKAKAAANKVQKELLKEEAAARRVERERVCKLKEEQKAQARMERQAELLVKKQAKALEAMRKDFKKAAKPAKLLRKALVRSKVAVVVLRAEIGFWDDITW